MESMIQARKQQLQGGNRKGFTLVELIVVIVILGILLAISIPALTGYITKAQDESLKADARLIKNACQEIGSDQYVSVTLSTNNPTKAQLMTATGATITGTAGVATQEDWFTAINYLNSASNTGTVYVVYGTGNTITNFAYARTAGTIDTTTRWAVYDSAANSVTVLTGTAPLGTSAPANMKKIVSGVASVPGTTY